MSGENYLLTLMQPSDQFIQMKNAQINCRSHPSLRYNPDSLSVQYVGKGLLYTDIIVFR